MTEMTNSNLSMGIGCMYTLGVDLQQYRGFLYGLPYIFEEISTDIFYIGWRGILIVF